MNVEQLEDIYQASPTTSELPNLVPDFPPNEADLFPPSPASLRGLDRTPPQDINAEMSVLGGMLISKDAIADVISVLRSQDFYRPVHETIYDAILNLYGHGEPADAITVAAELTKRGELARIGGSTYLYDLMAEVPTAANVEYYAQIVADCATRRRLVEAGTRITQLGYATEGGEVEELVNNAQAEVYAVSDRNQANDYVPLKLIVDPLLDRMEAAGSTGEVTGLGTGFAELDQLTNGLHPGQMVVIAARPGVGKSTLALDMARAASIGQGKTAVMFSLEMNRDELTMRILAAEANVKLGHLRTGNLNDNDWSRLAAIQERVSEAPLYIDDSPNLTLMEIRAKARRLKQQYDLGLVVIDYLQLMTSGKRVESRQQEVAEFSRALKLLAKELDIPIVALSQLNRNAETRADRRPALADLRESGSIEQDADLVILLHREDLYEQEHPRAGEADFIIAKHRNGQTRTLAVSFQASYCKFTDMPS